jgi:type II secretory pathway pseudopilin PulG
MGRFATRLTVRTRREERGMALIEVVASAALLAIIALALFGSLDVASSTSGDNKHRGIAASLAQDDQERMRGLEVRTLVQRSPEVRDVKLGNVTYKVESRAVEVSHGGSGGCTEDAGGIDYLKITSIVTWPGMRVNPVQADSLMAPRPGSFGPDEGGLAVALLNRDGGPLQGIDVSLSGAVNKSDTTDENGCAFFTYIPTGDYTLSFSSSGFVTPSGVQDVSEVVSVPKGAVGNESMQYDRAARLTVNIITKRADGTPVADPAASIAVEHPNVPAGLIPFAPTAATPDQVDTGPTLFPFASPYTVYAGSCVDANPSKRPVTPPDIPASVQLDPGGSGTATVIEPEIRLVVDKADGSDAAGANVRFDDITCGGAPVTGQTDAQGLLSVGLPYGDYNVCVQDSGEHASLAVANDREAGVDPPPVTLSTSVPAC